MTPTASTSTAARPTGRLRTVLSFNATLPVTVFGAIHELDVKQAQHIPEDHPRAPLKGGWLLRGAHLNPPVPDKELREGRIVRVEDLEGFPRPFGDQVNLEGASYFLRTAPLVRGGHEEPPVVPVRQHRRPDPGPL